MQTSTIVSYDKPLYMPQIDGLRAIAVIMVVISHWAEWSWPLFGGRVGVILFFLLSGFLITTILLDNRQRIENENVLPSRVLIPFYIRRFLRIWPLYYVVLLIAFILGLPEIHNYIGWHAAYLSNILFIREKSWMGTGAHFWSLAVEEQFYLFWPAVLLFLPLRWLKISIISTIGIAIFSRWLFLYVLDNSYAAWTWPLCTIDSFGLGAILAYLKWKKIDTAHVRSGIFILSTISLIVFWSLHIYLKRTEWNSQLWDTFRDTLTAGILLTPVYRASENVHSIDGWILSRKPVVFIGKISYGIYLLHNFIPTLLGIYAPRLHISSTLLQPPISYGVYFSITLLLSIISWYFFEKRLLTLKRYAPYPSTA